MMKRAKPLDYNRVYIFLPFLTALIVSTASSHTLIKIQIQVRVNKKIYKDTGGINVLLVITFILCITNFNAQRQIINVLKFVDCL